MFIVVRETVKLAIVQKTPGMPKKSLSLLIIKLLLTDF